MSIIFMPRTKFFVQFVLLILAMSLMTGRHLLERDIVLTGKSNLWMLFINSISNLVKIVWQYGAQICCGNDIKVWCWLTIFFGDWFFWF
jgi:hypothetical protein